MNKKIRQFLKAHPIIKTGSRYSIWASIRSVFNMLVGLAVMRWLTPDELGLWNTVSIFLAYTPFLQLGIQSGLNIDLPVLLGKGDTKQAEEKVANGFGYACLISVIILIIGIVLTIIYIDKGVEEACGIVTITIVAIAGSFQLHLIARYRSANAFDRLTTIYIIDIPLLIISVLLVYLFHYWGILVFNVLTNTIDAVLMYVRAPYRHIKPKLKKLTLFNMGKMGVAMMVLVQLRTAAQTLPRWIILAKTNREKLGLYTPATAINSLINLIPNQVAQFFYPQMGYKYGQTGMAKDIWPYVKKLLWLLPLAVLPISLTIYVLSPWLLTTFFPKYLESLWAMRIMCFTFIFTSASGLTWVFNTLRAFKYSYICAIIDFAGCFVWPYLASTILNYDILTTVTLGLAFNAIVTYIISIVMLKKVLHLSIYNMPHQC